VDQDTRTEIGNVASALKALLAAGEGDLPDLPTAISHVADIPVPTQQPQAVAAPDEPPLTLPDDLGALREMVADCTRCKLHSTRRNTVFGEGPVNPIVMVVGEGAGPVEDETGRPFSGEAGKLLTNILRAMGLDREKDCYLTTVLKCRIPDDSTPTPDVVGRCRPFLEKQISEIKPRFILAMGQTAASVLAGSPSITRLRGRFLMAGDTPMLVTYHPAALLKDPALKKLVWQDVQLIMERIKKGESK